MAVPLNEAVRCLGGAVHTFCSADPVVALYVPHRSGRLFALALNQRAGADERLLATARMLWHHLGAHDLLAPRAYFPEGETCDSSVRALLWVSNAIHTGHVIVPLFLTKIRDITARNGLGQI